MTTDPSSATDIDAAILDRMTDTLVILQAKSTSVDRGRMIAALQAIRRQLPDDAQLLLVEGESDAHVVREYLLAIERTSLGAPDARRARTRATAGRVADILIRHRESVDPPTTDDAGSAQFLASQDYALDDQDAVTVAASRSRDSTTCADALDQVDDYLASELSAEEGAKVRQHLETCSPCLRKYSLWLAVNLLVKKHCGCDLAPPDLREKVMARIRVIAEASQPEPWSEVRCEDCEATIKVHRDRSNPPTRCKSCRAARANNKQDAKAMPTPLRGSPPS